MTSSDDDSFHFEFDSAGISRTTYRSSGACVHCKSLKVRCVFNPGESVCQRCQAGNHRCLARDRKKRKAAPTHEDLQEKSLRQDRQIEELLLKFDEIRTKNKIMEFVVKAQSDSSPSPSEAVFSETSGPRSGCPPDSSAQAFRLPKREYMEGSAELAVSAFFPNDRAPGSQFHFFPPPDVIKYCSLYPEEIMELFNLFFERVNPYFSILDPELHTPGRLIWTSPFLFTVICAIASRYYTTRPNIYMLAMEFARDAAGKALIDGSKSVDVCQAYLLLAVYPVPKKKCEKWADDRSWLLMGVAIRMATELGLNQQPSSEYNERENLNRTRTWLNCFCVDGSHATQFGKLPMLRLDDYLARHSRSWYSSSSFNLPIDIHLCAYVEMITLMAEFRSAVGEYDLRQRVHEVGFDVTPIAIQFDKKLSELMAVWVELYVNESNTLNTICSYRANTTQMITAYLRLVVLSLGFQYAVKDGISRDSYIVQESINAARDVIQIMTQRLFPSGLLRFSMEAHFLYVAFAAAFLINLLRPKFLVLLDPNQTAGIIALVRQLIKILGSNEVALDDRHTPALYSRFLFSLLARHHVPDSSEDNVVYSAQDDIVPQYSAQRQQTPPNVYAWPDTSCVLQGPLANVADHSTEYNDGMICQLSGEADMDFSVQHFVHTVSAQDALSAATSPGFHSAQEAFQEWDVLRGDAVRADWPSEGPFGVWPSGDRMAASYLT